MMYLYAGRKDERTFIVSALGVNEAYRLIGTALGVVAAEPENIDLDDFQILPAFRSGECLELFKGVDQ